MKKLDYDERRMHSNHNQFTIELSISTNLIPLELEACIKDFYLRWTIQFKKN